MVNKKKVLFVSYDGMTDPLGQSQVLSYLKIISRQEFSFHLISYEKPEIFEKNKESIYNLIRGFDIEWHPLFFGNKIPVASAIANLRDGKRKITELAKEHAFDIFHARCYLPCILGEWTKNRYGSKLMFDMRGWWADEKKESGMLASPFLQPVYRYLKIREKGFFKNSEIAVSLTHIGKRFIVENNLKKENLVDVIPTCVNFEYFPPYDESVRKKIRTDLNIPPESVVMLYSGSLGGNYRTDLVLKLFKYLLKQKPESYFIFLSHSSPKIIKNEIIKSGLPQEKFRNVSADYRDVHKYLMAGDFGVVMYDDDFSVIGRSPTKLGEYWSAGLKMLSAKGIGDLDEILKLYPQSGVLVEDINNEKDYGKAIEQILLMKTSREELRGFAYDYYDLEKGAEKFTANYRKMLSM